MLFLNDVTDDHHYGSSHNRPTTVQILRLRKIVGGGRRMRM